MPLTFQEWIGRESAALRERFHNFDRWDTAGSPSVVIRVTKDQDKRAVFKNMSSRGRYTVVAFEDDREVYRNEYHLIEGTNEAMGGGPEAERNGAC